MVLAQERSPQFFRSWAVLLLAVAVAAGEGYVLGRSVLADRKAEALTVAQFAQLDMIGEAPRAKQTVPPPAASPPCCDGLPPGVRPTEIPITGIDDSQGNLWYVPPNRVLEEKGGCFLFRQSSNDKESQLCSWFDRASNCR
jgi:hypothetical protein